MDDFSISGKQDIFKIKNRNDYKAKGIHIYSIEIIPIKEKRDLILINSFVEYAQQIQYSNDICKYSIQNLQIKKMVIGDISNSSVIDLSKDINLPELKTKNSVEGIVKYRLDCDK